MALFVRDGGAWKEVESGKLWVRDGGSWKQVQKAWVRDGGTWKDFYQSLSVSPDTTLVTHERLNTADCFAMLRYNADGDEYRNTLSNSSVPDQNMGTWLESGSSSEVWIQRVINSGTLDWADPGSGRHSLSTSRDFGIVRTTGEGIGESTANVTFNFYNASSGGSLLASITVDFSATLTV